MSRANENWKGRRLLLLRYIFAKRGEAFVCDLGQPDAIDSFDANKSVL